MERALMQVTNRRARTRNLSGLPAAGQTYFTGYLFHRGFTINVPAIHGPRHLDGVEQALERQVDIVADTGIYPGVLDFLRSRKIIVTSDLNPQLGRFFPDRGIEISPAIQYDGDKPVLLHELLHAFHYSWLPKGFTNPGVLDFFRRAEWWQSHPMSCYAMSNVAEFFAVTASAYLVGAIDRVPYTRENLEARQPNYCDWLYELFGV